MEIILRADLPESTWDDVYEALSKVWCVGDVLPYTSRRRIFMLNGTKTTLLIRNVDVALLRRQRDHLLTLPPSDELTGLVNLLDHMLDVAEGFDV